MRDVVCTEALSCAGVLAPSVHAVSAPVGSSSSCHGASRSTRTSIVVSFVARRRSARRGSLGGSAGANGAAPGSAQPWMPPSVMPSMAARKEREKALKVDSSWWWALPPRTLRSERSHCSAVASEVQNSGVSSVRYRPIQRRPVGLPVNCP